MAKPLVIVESPAKARTIAGFLGAGYIVESSVGNIRDLPRNASEIPESVKGEPWANLAVNVNDDFQPLYIVPKDKRAQVAKLKALLKDADELYLATDEDREGESIAWHLLQELKPKVPVKRMVFHEISKEAITRAAREGRDLNLQLVEAQETRRILDRLFGYEVSPVLWKKVMPGLSAGRVQSVFTRIVVERERERMRFRSADWWGITGQFTDTNSPAFNGNLVSLDSKRIATGKDFDELGALSKADAVLLDEEKAVELTAALEGVAYAVRSVQTKPYRQSPKAPFMTSTLQQEAGRKLGLSTRQAMQVAQRLYENGYITYMRTDSTQLSETAVTAARAQISQIYGPDFVPASPRSYGKKSRNAQEAHEAIRPAGDTFRTPDQVKSQLNSDEFRMYDMVWKRTVASQMADALGSSVSVRFGATCTDGRDAEFSASGRTITFPGFRKAYVESTDDGEDSGGESQSLLPELVEGQSLTCNSLEAAGHSTQPPARFTEPTLIRAVEEMGVGRPSTYASMISTIQDRGYVWKKGSALVPSWLAFAVITLLEKHFPDLVDYAFTARMEEVLDGISNGTEQSRPWLKKFYFGNGQPGLHEMVTERLSDIDAREINSIVIGESDGKKTVVRVGRFGPYLEWGEQRASIPDDLPPDELTVERALQMLAAPRDERTLGDDPETGLPVLAKSGRYGPFVQLGEAGGDTKPKTSSLLKTMDLANITLEEGLKLLSLPRSVGNDPSDGEEISALNGKFGPYLKKGTDSRSLATEEEMFTVSLEEALALFAQPKQRGRRAAAPPLREFGPDPVSGKPVVLKEGRFGPYVTDGETNASLRRDDDPATITEARAFELLQDRRDRGPAPKKPRKAAAKKSSTRKKASAAKKPAAKKPAAKKPAAKRKATRKPKE